MTKSLAVFVLVLATLQLARSGAHFNVSASSSNYTVLYQNGSENSSCEISARFTSRRVNLDLFVNDTNYGELPVLTLMNYAGDYPVNETAAARYSGPILEIVNETNSTRTYGFNYKNVVAWIDTPCMQFEDYSVGCRFQLYRPDINFTTDLFITVYNPRNESTIKISGTGYNNQTNETDVIDTTDEVKTNFMKKYLYLSVGYSNVSRSHPLIDLFWDASSYTVAHMMTELRPFAYGVQCYSAEGQRTYNIFANWTGDDKMHHTRVVFNLSSIWLSTSSLFYTCRSTILFTERSNNHSVIALKVANNFTFTSGREYTPERQYKPVQNSSYGSNKTYNYNSTEYNYTYYNRSRYYNRSNNTNSSYNYTYSNVSSPIPCWFPSYCEYYENRFAPKCILKKFSNFKPMAKLIIVSALILALCLVLCACKVCCCSKQKKTHSGNNYYEMSNTSAPQPFTVVHHAAPAQVTPNAMSAVPVYLVGGLDGTKFMVIPQKV